MENFDFDEWSALAKAAPEEFESRRHDAIERIISNCTNTRRLRGLQCRIDLERARARTPLKSCLRLSEMMWDSFNECQTQLKVLAYGLPQQFPSEKKPTSQAKILPFQSRK
jgi:hypothetical protein